MKTAPLLLLALSLSISCNRSEKAADDTTTQSPTTDTVAVAAPPAPQNCQQLVTADKLGKANAYQESAKPISVSITIEAGTGTLQTGSGCYVNNTATVRATKKSGGYLFKRTFLKDDIAYFRKGDEAIGQSVLQTVVYKPSFNGQKYMTLTMRLLNPETKKKTDYELFLNYFGEIVKVR